MSIEPPSIKAPSWTGDLTFNYSADPAIWRKAFCVKPSDDICAFGPCPNTDVSGLGQEISSEFLPTHFSPDINSSFFRISLYYHCDLWCVRVLRYICWCRSVMWDPRLCAVLRPMAQTSYDLRSPVRSVLAHDRRNGLHCQRRPHSSRRDVRRNLRFVSCIDIPLVPLYSILLERQCLPHRAL